MCFGRGFVLRVVTAGRLLRASCVEVVMGSELGKLSVLRVAFKRSYCCDDEITSGADSK